MERSCSPAGHHASSYERSAGTVRHCGWWRGTGSCLRVRRRRPRCSLLRRSPFLPLLLLLLLLLLLCSTAACNSATALLLLNPSRVAPVAGRGRGRGAAGGTFVVVKQGIREGRW